MRRLKRLRETTPQWWLADLICYARTNETQLISSKGKSEQGSFSPHMGHETCISYSSGSDETHTGIISGETLRHVCWRGSPQTTSDSLPVSEKKGSTTQ